MRSSHLFHIVLLVLLAITLVGCEGVVYTYWNGSSSVSCQGDGSTARCTVNFTPHEDFNWVAASNPGGATFSPSFSSVSSGESSGDIQVTLPSTSGGDQMALYFTDTTNHIQLTLDACYTFCFDSSS